jgi:hypothetical protein
MRRVFYTVVLHALSRAINFIDAAEMCPVPLSA